MYPSDNDTEWFLNAMGEQLALRFREGELRVPGHTRPDLLMRGFKLAFKMFFSLAGPV
jgi:hypothetical protein